MSASQAIPDSGSSYGNLIYLDPEEIRVDDVTNVRLGPPALDEDKRIAELAESILSEGQLQPVLVRPDNDGFYSLIAGRRRLAAVRQLLSNTAEGEEPVISRIAAVVVDKSDEDSYRAALMENLKRKAMSPIDLAHNIQVIRVRNNWEGRPGTKHVAEYLGVSPATITTHEKLLTLPMERQTPVHEGKQSVEAALELATNVEPTKLDEVAVRAEELAVDEAKAKSTQKRGRTKREVSTPQTASADPASAGETAKESKSKGVKVSRKHIVRAAKEKGALKANKAPNKADILEFFESVGGGSDYPAPMTAFADAIVGPYAEGKLSDKQLLNRWDAIAACCTSKPNPSSKSKAAKNLKKTGQKSRK